MTTKKVKPQQPKVSAPEDGMEPVTPIDYVATAAPDPIVFGTPTKVPEGGGVEWGVH